MPVKFFCPKCNNTEIKVTYSREDDEIYEDCKCEKCNNSWYNTFIFSRSYTGEGNQTGSWEQMGVA